MLNGAKLLTMWSDMIIANKCVKEGKKKSSQKALFLTKIHKHEAAWAESPTVDGKVKVFCR